MKRIEYSPKKKISQTGEEHSPNSNCSLSVVCCLFHSVHAHASCFHLLWRVIQFKLSCFCVERRGKWCGLNFELGCQQFCFVRCVDRFCFC